MSLQSLHNSCTRFGPRQAGARGRVARRALGLLAASAASLFYACMGPVMRAILAVHFRRVRALHRERIPRHGAALVVANHPSTWTDVVVLDVIAGRKLHFLAHHKLFCPWPRGVLLWLYGTLPVFTHADGPDYAERNAEVFRRCEALFDRGEAVAMFPEGVSMTDRALLPFKPGAARLALLEAARTGGSRGFALVPVGLHYSDRTAFHSEVTVSVGDPMNAAELRAWDSADPEASVRLLTARLVREMSALLLDVPDPGRASLVALLEPIVAGPAGSLELERARSLAHALAVLEAQRPEWYATLLRHGRAYARVRAALRVPDHALAERGCGVPARTRRAARILVLLAGAAPAAAGAVLHAVPSALAQVASRRYASDPSHVAFARIGAGIVFFPPTYAAIGWLLARRFGLGPIAIVLALAACAALGVGTLAYVRAARFEWEHWRLAWIARTHARLVDRALAERAALAKLAAERVGRGAPGPELDPNQAGPMRGDRASPRGTP